MIRKIFLFILVSTYICIAYCQFNSTQKPEDVPGIPARTANKRFRYLVGGKTAVDLTNYQNLVNIQRLSQAVIQSMNRNWYGTNSWALANVISATTQVVSGQSYDITFTIGQTVCQNNRVLFFFVEYMQLVEYLDYSTYFF